jgi:oligopeptide/dipeptide ABC transporter ATP-binding protein
VDSRDSIDASKPSTSVAPAKPLLEVQNLCVAVNVGAERINLVEDISFTLSPGEILGVLGESGAGKTVMCRSLVGLVDGASPLHSWKGGESKVIFEGENLLFLSEGELSKIRGRRIAFVPQDPMQSLHPTLSIKTQLTELLRQHESISHKEALQRSIEMLDRVGIKDPERVINDCAHQFSGGMRQRVLIAMALLCKPSLIIADEPTTALDSMTQSKVVDLIIRLCRESELSLIWITHDLSLLAQFSDRIAVIYAGRMVELGPSERIFKNPKHPYTQALLRCTTVTKTPGRDPLPSIKGPAADIENRVKGCGFHPRCEYAQPICAAEEPGIRQHGLKHWSACILEDDSV